MASDLRFPQTHERKGFSTDATARRDGSPEPVVRELLQNSLDAAKDASRATPDKPAEVVFTISECSWESIPGGDSYRKAFKSAVQARKQLQEEGLSIDEERIVNRIQSVLDSASVQLLFCRDNGTGISDMERVFFEGNSSKPRTGGGSVGVGHMTAFAASDLRYILYAGRTNIAAIAGGHAILAAHPDGRVLLSGDGYYTKGDDLLSYDPDNPSKYHADLPFVLEGEMAKVESTGSLVCITGFNNFRDDEDPSEAICRVAAINFLAAIQRNELVISVLSGAHGAKTVDGANIGEVLEKRSSEQRVRGARVGYLAGGRAFRAYETLTHGYRLDIEGYSSDDIEVYFRPSSSLNERSQVNIFRDGMWVDLNPLGLHLARFTSVRPFDGVVLLHRSGRLYELVRSAEGPEHRGLENYRELSRATKTEIQDQFEKIAKRLAQEAGEEDNQEYTPQGFAVLQSTTLREAEPLPRYRPRRDQGRQATTHHTDTGGEDGPEHDPNRRNRNRRGAGTRPAPGTTVAVRSSIRLNQGKNGKIDTLTVAWTPRDGERVANLAVRVRVASGSDETCDQPLRPEWLKLDSIEYDNKSQSALGDGWELPLPQQPGVVTIRLASPLVSTAGIELDIVRRRPT